MEWNIINSYYKNYNPSFIQIESFNHFVDTLLPEIVSGTIFKANISPTKTYIVHFGNIYVESPMVSDSQKTEKLYPNEARLCDLNYDSMVYVDISTRLLENGKLVDENVHTYIPLFKFPTMVRSAICNLSKTHDHHDEVDNGGYFIIKGKERVLIAQERINYNHIYVYSDKKGKSAYTAEIRSIKEDADFSYSVMMKIRVANGIILVSIPYIQQDIPLSVVLVAMEIDLDRFGGLFSDPRMMKFIKKSITNARKLDYSESIDYIARYTKSRIPENNRKTYIIQLLRNEILPHLGVCSGESIADYIALIIRKLFLVEFGDRPEDDRDHICNKRVEMSGYLIGNLLKALFKKFVKTTQQRMEKKGEMNIVGAIQRFNISQRLYHCFSTGNWGVQGGKYIRQGVSQVLSRLSYIGTVSHLRRLIIPIGKESKNTQVRQLHPSSFGFTDCVETPDGATAGLVKAFSLPVKISTGFPTVFVQDTLIENSDYLELTERNLGKTQLLVDGVWIGSVENPNQTVEKLRLMRENYILDRSISIGYDPIDNEISIHSDDGRILRPVINVKHEKYPQLNELSKNGWRFLEDVGLIVFVDGYEIDFSHIAMNPEEIIPETSFLEIHPSLLLGVCSALIPFPDHSQAPRNLYATGMMKQSIGMFALNYNQRFDTVSHVLHYPQLRVVETRYDTSLGMHDNPNGVNAIVAVACYTGFNMEDSVIVNKSAIDRGLFRSTAYKTISTSETKRGAHGGDRIEIPPEHLQNSSLDYSKLGKDGIVFTGARVEANTVLVGRVLYRNEEIDRDTSLICSASEAGIVDKICITLNSHGYMHVKIRIRSERIPEVGDKLASLAAQKGTIGLLMAQEDMPFSIDGIVPDVILNSHALPSRMTINMMMEQLCGKEGCVSGKIHDSTAFVHSDSLVDEISDSLKTNGYDPLGDETFYNGMTGEQFKMKIFAGVCYYQRLKHLISDKQHVRSEGQIQTLTRQPTEGRSKLGGLRLGEMERDSLIAHGTSLFLKERLFDMSDPYQVWVCANCGGMLVNNTSQCNICESDNRTFVDLPYASKLLFQELNAMGLKINLK